MEGNGPVDDEKTNNHVSEEDTLEKCSKLEKENKKMHKEFSIQRARMKELLLQKDSECEKLSNEIDSIKKELDEVKSQLLVTKYKTEGDMQQQERKAQEEIASLQQLVQDTIEESSIFKGDFQRLQSEFETVKQENRDLRELLTQHQQQQQQQDTTSLAPVLSHVKKTLARKLGADSSGGQDSLDDAMRKAQEDAEVLRSLVVPLDEEIKALKEKLRRADEELQKFRGSNYNNTLNDSALIGMINDKKRSSSPLPPPPQSQQQQQHQDQQDNKITAIGSETVSKSTSMDGIECDMCKNYESKLSQSQTLLSKEKQKLEHLQKNLTDAKEELNKEAALRRDLEDQWQEKREAHKEQVQHLTEQVKKSEKELDNFQQKFLDTKNEINEHLSRLTTDRENINKHLETLQNDNDFLSGQYLASSEELQNQPINLPNNVEELHELFLKQNDELVKARLGCEYEKKKCVSFIDEAQVLRDQLDTAISERKRFEKDVQTRMRSLEDRLKEFLGKQQDTENKREEFEKKQVEFNKQSSEFREQIFELRETNEKYEKTNAELKQRLCSLQNDLKTSEQVQKDFVKLSQSLQITLEKIRQADTQVRWQNDEDIDNCPNCNITFTVTCRKQHCRHCGTIYCEKCLTKTVPSGPRNKLARVCDICHTLLIPNTAPYFSQAPPQSPT